MGEARPMLSMFDDKCVHVNCDLLRLTRFDKFEKSWLACWYTHTNVDEVLLGEA